MFEADGNAKADEAAADSWGYYNEDYWLFSNMCGWVAVSFPARV